MTESISETLAGPRGALIKARARRLCGSDPDARLLGRVECVLLVNEGRSIAEVARWFGVHRRTLERWMAQYRRHGEAGLQDESRTGGHQHNHGLHQVFFHARTPLWTDISNTSSGIDVCIRVQYSGYERRQTRILIRTPVSTVPTTC